MEEVMQNLESLSIQELLMLREFFRELYINGKCPTIILNHDQIEKARQKWKEVDALLVNMFLK